MTRDEVAHVLRAARALTNEEEFVLVGSQAAHAGISSLPAVMQQSGGHLSTPAAGAGRRHRRRHRRGIAVPQHFRVLCAGGRAGDGEAAAGLAPPRPADSRTRSPRARSASHRRSTTSALPSWSRSGRRIHAQAAIDAKLADPATLLQLDAIDGVLSKPRPGAGVGAGAAAGGTGLTAQTARISAFSSTRSTCAEVGAAAEDAAVHGDDGVLALAGGEAGALLDAVDRVLGAVAEDREDRRVTQHRDAVVAPQAGGDGAAIEAENDGELGAVKGDRVGKAGELRDLGTTDHDARMPGRPRFGKRARRLRQRSSGAGGAASVTPPGDTWREASVQMTVEVVAAALAKRAEHGGHLGVVDRVARSRRGPGSAPRRRRRSRRSRSRRAGGRRADPCAAGFPRGSTPTIRWCC